MGWEDPTLDWNYVLGGNDAPTYTAPVFNSEEIDIATFNASAPRMRTTDELAAAIKTAGGKLTVPGNSSQLIVALNNLLRFSVTQTPSGDFEIQDRFAGNTIFLIAIPAAILLVVLIMSSR